jgi:hypothetical protein
MKAKVKDVVGLYLELSDSFEGAAQVRADLWIVCQQHNTRLETDS